MAASTDDNKPNFELKSTAELQLSEVEMLRSMFPNSGEFEVDDEESLTDMQSFVDGETDNLSVRLRFSLMLTIPEKGDVELVCQLPHEYPETPPECFLRSQHLSKTSRKSLADKLQSYVSENFQAGELFITPIIYWLQDNAAEYMADSSETAQQQQPQPRSDDVFSRIWIYSHHIYSKIKRRDILQICRELGLSGFCMPGKPGIICVEGYRTCVDEFWLQVRRWQWKKIALIEREDVSIESGSSDDLRSLKKFEGFVEESFIPRQGKGRGAHSDRGLLLRYLEEHHCAGVFHSLFGIEPDNQKDGTTSD